MKKNLNYKHIFLACLMCMTVVSCKKFEVLSNIDPDLVDAGTNLKTISVWSFISGRSDNKGVDTLKSLDLYAAAIERVGLRQLLEGDGDFTVIAPRNDALKSLALSLGYTTVEAIPDAVLRNIFLNNIIDTRVRSFEIQPELVNLYKTLNEDSLSIRRQPSSSNEYILNLYNAPSLSTSLARVRSQNLECKNGIVHVVDDFRAYSPRYLQPEAAKLSGDTIYVTKDAYINNGSGALKSSNFGSSDLLWVKKASANTTRRAILQFPVRNSIKFTENIAGVTLYVFNNRVDSPGGIVSVYEDENIDWIETDAVPANPSAPGVNWYNAPAAGNVSLFSFSFPRQSRADTIVSAGVGAAYKAALADGKTFINLGLNTGDSPLFQFLSKEALDENRVAGKFAAYLVLTPEQNTVLVNPVNTGLIVDLQKGYKKITIAELNFSGTLDRNVTYSFSTKPTNGFVVVDGNANVSSFTQAQLVRGSVKYLYSGSGAGTDSFIVVARDSEGNSFPTEQTVNVQIQ